MGLALQEIQERAQLGGLIEYDPRWPPVLLTQTRWKTYCTQSVVWLSESAFSTYPSSVESLVDVFGLGGTRVAYASWGRHGLAEGPG